MPRPDDRAAGAPRARSRWLPELPDVLTADQVLDTGRSISRMQQRDGAIGWPDGHVDAWNHVECAMALSACGLTGAARRAYGWLRRSQRADGSWPKRTEGARITDGSAESNHAAYPAVGAWHELLVTADAQFAERMWPMVRGGVEFALGLQRSGGEIIWQRTADGAPGDYALLTGCSSIHHSLRCAIAYAEYIGEPQPDWELAAGQLAHAIAAHPEAFADKSWFSMDWYYPVLGGAVRGPAAGRRLAAGWDTFVVPGLGVRCVSDQPWVTGAETAELAITLDAIGDRSRALASFAEAQHLRAEAGGYWTGWQFVNQAHFPGEQSSWTAAAMVLAADTLSGATGASAIFRDAAASWTADCGPAEPAACGCPPGGDAGWSGNGPTSADARPTAADARPTAADCRPTSADCRPTSADARPTSADARPTSADAR